MIQISNLVPLSIQSTWDKALKLCANPLGLTESVLQKSLEVCPPREYQGGKYLGRYLIPDKHVRYNPEEQPRDKSNVTDMNGKIQKLL